MHKYVLVCCVWIALGVDSLEPDEDDEKEGKYKFRYAVHDPESGNFQSRHEEMAAEVLKGQYSIQHPDGVKTTVAYKVDGPSGFVASVHNEDCQDCAQPSPFEAGYEMKYRNADSYVRSYFFMGSRLGSSEVQMELDGAKIYTRTMHAQH